PPTSRSPPSLHDALPICATADNPDVAMVRGIDTERIVAWTWLIGGGLAASGGVLFGLASQLRPEMGFVSILLPVFAAVILGGIEIGRAHVCTPVTFRSRL